jgi:large subunit ribosomal protein L19
MATKVISPVNIDFRKNLDIRPGDTVRVWQKVQEDKGKFRLQAFEGIVLARKHGTEAGAMFTVRKVIDGVGVERIFPIYSPMIDSVEMVRRSKVRRAKLYFIREKATKEIRRQMRRIMDAKYDEEVIPVAEVAADAPKEAAAGSPKA